MPTFRTLPLGAIRPLGWLLSQLQHDLDDGFASRLDQLTRHAANNLFEQRIESSSAQVAWWDSETRGNWLWGYVMMAGLAGSPAHLDRTRSLVEALKASQDADGYIGIYSPASRYAHLAGENGELWGQSRALLPLLAYYELSGDPAYLQAVEKAVRLTMAQYGPGRSYFQRGEQKGRDVLTGLAHGLCYCDVLEWLFALTGDEDYSEFGRWLYADFSAMPRPFFSDDLAQPNLLESQHPFSGHAVHTAEHLRALLWAASLEDSPQTDRGVRAALARLRDYCLPSGALLGDEAIHGLPTPDIGYEYCTLTELLFSLSSALQKSGDIFFGDWMETLAFNAAQGARLADGTAIAYLSSDTRREASARVADAYSNDQGGGRFKYSPTHEDVACCCNPNSVRFLPHTISRMWLSLADRPGLAAVVYGSCRLKTRVGAIPVEIREDTGYPFSNRVTFTIQPEAPLDCALLFRRPGWASAVQVEAAGADSHEESGWIHLHKTWQPGDVVCLEFETGVRAVPYPGGALSLHYGPLQFAAALAPVFKETKDYPLPGFHDYDVLPVSPGEEVFLPMIEESSPNFGFTVVEDPGADLRSPWSRAPIRLKRGSLELVPLGCTILRQAHFHIGPA